MNILQAIDMFLQLPYHINTMFVLIFIIFTASTVILFRKMNKINLETTVIKCFLVDTNRMELIKTISEYVKHKTIRESHYNMLLDMYNRYKSIGGNGLVDKTWDNFINKVQIIDD